MSTIVNHLTRTIESIVITIVTRVYMGNNINLMITRAIQLFTWVTILTTWLLRIYSVPSVYSSYKCIYKCDYNRIYRCIPNRMVNVRITVGMYSS